MKKSFSLLATVAGLVVLPSMACAADGYFGTFAAMYPNAKATTGIYCGVCHDTRTGPGPKEFNSYGSAWSSEPHSTTAQQNAAFIALEPLDSDGDGYTNLTEILANTATVIVNPGDPASVPAKLLFCDNFRNAVGKTIPDWTKSPDTAAWTGNRSVLTSPATGNTFINPIPPNAWKTALPKFKTGYIQVTVKLVSMTKPLIRIVFSEASTSAYRYVQITNSGITIGQVNTVGGVAPDTPTRVAYGGFASAAHTVKIAFAPNGGVSVFLDNAATPKVTHTFSSAVAGKIGFMTAATEATFDNVTISR
ncbi:MAG TPA: hypothetical protein VEF34_13570 [Syntrophobacteraceae bacterium]|nr:hypothetical protein [Syntrophobacteraceae bacterium]